MEFNWLNDVLNNAALQVEKIAVFVVANVSENKNLKDVNSRENEHFNENELLEIVNGFRDFGYYCDYFIGEEEFIRWVSGGGAKHLPFESCVIYNTAQSGKGPGRKSLIPAYCDLHNIVRLNSNAYTASLARHKFHTHCILEKAGILTPKTWWFLPNGKWFGDKKPKLGERVITKSTYESASIGVSEDGIFNYDHTCDKWMLNMTKKLGQGVIVQELVEGWEIETPLIIRNKAQALPPVCVGLNNSPKMGTEIFHFDTVNKENYHFYDVPEEVLGASHTINKIAESVADILEIQGLGRVDFRINDQGVAKVIDVSTTPHLVRHSTFAYRFRKMGLRDADLFGALVGSYF